MTRLETYLNFLSDQISTSCLIKEPYLRGEQGHECMGQSKQRERG